MSQTLMSWGSWNFRSSAMPSTDGPKYNLIFKTWETPENSSNKTVMTCRHSYRKETNLSDIHDFDSSQLSCPLVTALCSTQINKSYFVATMVLIYFLTQLKRAGVPKQDLASVLRIVCEICYWLCSTSLFQWSPPVHKERAGTAREKSNINNNLRIVQLSNRGGVITHFGALLHSM